MKNLLKLKAIKLAALFLLLSSCQQKRATNQHFSIPEEVNKSSSEEEIYILSSNNFRGNIDSSSDSTFEQTPFTIAGSKYLSKYINIFKSHNSDDHILLDLGNFLGKQGENKTNTLKLFSELKYDAIVLSSPGLKDLTSKDSLNLPFVNSNILQIKSMKLVKPALSESYKIKTINNKRIAIVGISLLNLSSKKMPGLIYDDPVARLITLKSELTKVSDIIILAIQTNYQDDNIESYKKLIRRLPPGYINLVIASSTTSQTIIEKDIPLILTKRGNLFVNYIKIAFDTKGRIINKNIANIPVKLCSQFFEETMDCHVDPDDITKSMTIRKSQYKLIDAKFLGSPITN